MVSTRYNHDSTAPHLAMAFKRGSVLAQVLIIFFCFAWSILAQDGVDQDVLLNAVRKQGKGVRGGCIRVCTHSTCAACIRVLLIFVSEHTNK